MSLGPSGNFRGHGFPQSVHLPAELILRFHRRGAGIVYREVYVVIAMFGIFWIIPGCRPTVPFGNEKSPETEVPHSTDTTTDGARPPESPSTIRFFDRTLETGLVWTYRNDEEAGHYAILESLGGGVAAFDFDHDGDDDLFFTGGGRYAAGPSLSGLSGGLFRNQGVWRFLPVTGAAHVTESPFYSHGAAAADFDNDGFRDLLVTGYGGLQFWHNQGDGTFVSVTEVVGLSDPLWSSSAAWGDLNGDSILDLYVAHYTDWSFDNDPHCDGPPPDGREICPPRRFGSLPATLYFGNGDGTFRDGTEFAGLRSDGKGLGVVIGDMDLDGDLDVYQANDAIENFLYENRGRGILADVSLVSGTALSDRGVPDGSMGVDLFDFNRDGLPDLWVVNYEQENCALYVNSGKMLFRHLSQATGITAMGGVYVSWGTCCFDVDRDGDEDIFASNGHVIRYPTNSALRQLPLLLENLNLARFRNVAQGTGAYFRQPHLGRGAVISDFDGDGDVDLAVSHLNEPATLLSNETPPLGPWLAVELIGTCSSRDAIGAIITLSSAGGVQTRHWKGGSSYASTNSCRLHFGLGLDTTIDAIDVRWPSGIRQVVSAPAINQLVRVIEPRQKPASAQPEAQ